MKAPKSCMMLVVTLVAVLVMTVSAQFPCGQSGPPFDWLGPWNCGADPNNRSAVVVTLNREDSTLTVSGSGAMEDFVPNGIEDGEAYWNGKPYNTIVIGAGITHIGVEAFKSLRPLTFVTCSSSVPPTVGNNAFIGRNIGNADLLVPRDSENAYRNAEIWKNFGYINPSIIKFDSKGGTSIDSQKITYGGKVTKPADPIREGLTFNGWGWYRVCVTTPNTGCAAVAILEFWNFDTDTVTSDITLDAQWTTTTAVLSANRKSASSGLLVRQYAGGISVLNAKTNRPKIAIYNLSGKRQKASSVSNQDGIITVLLSNLVAGPYVVRVTDGKASMEKRILVR